MPDLDTIAPELRLNIYEHLLRFDTPLKRTLFHRLQIKLHGIGGPQAAKVDTAIFRVCRQIFDEALPVFYKSNVIWVCHSDVCVSDRYARTSLSCTKSLLVHARLTQNRYECENDDSEPTCVKRQAIELLQQFAGPQYPRLRSLTLEGGPYEGAAEWNLACGKIVADQLRKSGVEVTYTGLARFTVTLASSSTTAGDDPKHLTITSHCASVAEAFDHMSGLSRAEFEAAVLGEDICRLVDDECEAEVCVSFARAHTQQALLTEHREILDRAGLSRKDFDGQPLSAVMYERVTNASE
ncbi:hypothetical protein LTR15_012122 [Elasticomyces elasticus]|nr:hypothetical protein LTR15_012122 [Elasticomyces elasticus]